MARLAAGDVEALDDLYERHGTMAYSIALRITGDSGLAEDAVQEAFLGAWRNARRYELGRGSVRTWLLAIVHHRAIDLLRRRRATSALPEGDGTLPDALTLPDAWPEVSAKVDGAAVRAALTTIPIAQREALELAYFSGLTQPQIAARLGVPLGTIKSRVRLGLLALRSALGAAGYQPEGAEGSGDG
jgi:RNA polymerase sigma-70 factor (ECF subfamily)